MRRSIAAKECHCPLANASYTNLLHDLPTLARVGTKVMLPVLNGKPAAPKAKAAANEPETAHV